MEFVAFVGSDKENWGQVAALIKRIEAEKIILVKNKDAGEFPVPAKCDVITERSDRSLLDLKDELMKKLAESSDDDSLFIHNMMNIVEKTFDGAGAYFSLIL